MRILLVLGVVAWHAANFELATAATVQNVRDGNYSESNKLFALRSFQIIYEHQPGNLIYSPLSASMVLTMAAFGSEGNTKDEMHRGLALPIDDRETVRGIYGMVQRLDQSLGYELHVANKIFYNKDRTPNDEYIRFTRNVFSAPAQPIDVSRSSVASKTINDWCAKQTKQHINIIVNPDSITSDTELLLLNAVYFKGDWKVPFESKETELRDFYINGTTVRKVSTMKAEKEYRYGVLPEYQVTYIELPYAATPDTEPADAVSMFIMLPKAKDGLSTLMKNFHKIDLSSLLNAELEEVTLSLPKFKLETTIRLRKPLEQLGLVDMFTNRANFSRIAEGLVVSDVIQKSFIEVNEKGTEAAAATAIGLAVHNFPIQFTVDHPFVALIMKGDGTLLFAAAINDPDQFRQSQPVIANPTRHKQQLSVSDWTWPSV